MKWKNPTYDEVKILKKFAYLPEFIPEDNTNIWLESYFKVVRYGITKWHTERNFLTLEEAEKFIKHFKKMRNP